MREQLIEDASNLSIKEINEIAKKTSNTRFRVNRIKSKKNNRINEKSVEALHLLMHARQREVVESEELYKEIDRSLKYLDACCEEIFQELNGEI